MDNTEHKMTKAAQIRNMIAQAKAQGQDSNSLIAQVMSQFGFARQLARAYIANNWTKVDAPTVVLVQAILPTKQPKALSMSKDAIRKREKRAAEKAAKEVATAAV